MQSRRHGQLRYQSGTDGGGAHPKLFSFSCFLLWLRAAVAFVALVSDVDLRHLEVTLRVASTEAGVTALDFDVARLFDQRSSPSASSP